MAERLKKKTNNVIGHRPVSIDENLGNVVISSTNESRVEELLPNVQRHNNNKSAQMRQTLYNNPYLNKIKQQLAAPNNNF